MIVLLSTLNSVTAKLILPKPPRRSQGLAALECPIPVNTPINNLSTHPGSPLYPLSQPSSFQVLKEHPPNITPAPAALSPTPSLRVAGRLLPQLLNIPVATKPLHPSINLPGLPSTKHAGIWPPTSYLVLKGSRHLEPGLQTEHLGHSLVFLSIFSNCRTPTGPSGRW